MPRSPRTRHTAAPRPYRRPGDDAVPVYN